jgi:DNA-directed RNA polymerase subunit RPC12/RpoP
MNSYQWNYCRCGWQTEEPNVGTKSDCPLCGRKLLFVAGTKKEMDELKENLKNNKSIAQIMDK